jgi:RNA polymerase sigma-70 factor (ECF subfamily)
MDTDDETLLAAIGEGCEPAFNRFVDRHQQALRAFLRGLVTASDADDIAQEVFLAVWSRAGAYRGTGGARSWLFAIAWRKAKDGHRKLFRRRKRETEYHDAMISSELCAVTADERLALVQALMSLSMGERAAILLCLAAGFSHAEAADTLSMPLGTIKSHVLRGRERIRELLGYSA